MLKSLKTQEDSMFKWAMGILLISSAALAESKSYDVKGMTCDECRKSVEAEVCKLPGLDTCKVEMGKVTLMSKGTLDDTKVKAAVEKAGHYKVTGTTVAAAQPTATAEAPKAVTDEAAADTKTKKTK